MSFFDKLKKIGGDIAGGAEIAVGAVTGQPEIIAGGASQLAAANKPTGAAVQRASVPNKSIPGPPSPAGSLGESRSQNRMRMRNSYGYPPM